MAVEESLRTESETPEETSAQYQRLLSRLSTYERRARLLRSWAHLEDAVLAASLILLAGVIVGFLTGWWFPGWALLGLVLAGIGWCIEPWVRSTDHGKTSSSLDRIADLRDEAKSAYWLGQSDRRSEPLLVSLVERSSSRLVRLNFSQLLPFRPRLSRFAILPILVVIGLLSPSARESLVPPVQIAAEPSGSEEPHAELPSPEVQALLAENPELAQLRRMLMEGSLTQEQLDALNESLESLGLELEDLEATPEDSQEPSQSEGTEASAESEPDPNAEADPNAPAEGGKENQQQGEPGQEGEPSTSEEGQTSESDQSPESSESQPSDQPGEQGQASEGATEEQSGESEEEAKDTPSTGGGDEVSNEGSDGAEEAAEEEQKGNSGHSSGPSDLPPQEASEALPLEVQLELELMGQENAPPEMSVGRSNNVPSLAATGAATASAGSVSGQATDESAITRQHYPARLQNSIRRYFLQLSRKEMKPPK